MTAPARLPGEAVHPAGGLDSGIGDPSRSGGTALIDAVRAGAPFRSKGDTARARRGRVAAWVAEAALERPDGAVVPRTAREASYVA
ncbi:hypothetical protein AB0L59_15710 [Streptomyces sp. NPDC052109]|uniref:hypothetical protein n=1 Tax=Streptomyces sp. NPDC052109 TaxID=3155527 RepID=UPI00343D71BF